MSFAVLPPPTHQQRAPNIMTSGSFGNAADKAGFNDAHLLRICPAPTTARIGDRKDLYVGSVSMVGHNAGPKPRSSNQKDGPRRRLTADLRPIYEAPTAEEAARQLDAFEDKWGGKYPSIAPAWRRAWAEVTPFYAFSAAIRKIIYTTNAVESLNRVLRKTLKTKGSFPTEEAATKLIFLAIRNFEKGGRAVREWVAARNQLAIMFTGRFDA